MKKIYPMVAFDNWRELQEDNTIIQNNKQL
jgi:hypothetical protein